MGQKINFRKLSFLNMSRAYQITTVIIAVYLGISAATLSYARVFYQADEALTNVLYKYNPFVFADERITIISIDGATKELYGDNNEWSRSLYADVVDRLAGDGAAVIGMDVNLARNGDAEGDDALVEACKNAGNVIVPINASFIRADEAERLLTGGEQWQAEGAPPENHQYESTFASNPDSFHVPAPMEAGATLDELAVRMEYPYEALCEVATLGVVNALQESLDGTIRNAVISVYYGEDEYDSFAVAVYKRFCKETGTPFSLPEIDENGMFGFNSMWNTDDYQKIPCEKLLAGDYDASLIDGKIVLVGEYESIAYKNAKEFLESRWRYQEVMLDASILQAILSDKVVVDIDPLFQALFYGITITVFYIMFASKKKLLAFIGQLGWGASVFIIAYVFNLGGYRFMLLIPLVFAFLSTMIFLLQHVLLQFVERKRMEATLKMYVDSKVVNQLEEVSPFALTMVSERKSIAVLFVDIRGFTTLSEQLEPEQVVEVLNEYFTLVYASIQAWNGTLDKFIGDAAMAFFNAPEDDEDYIFHAVCAADDIQKGFEVITARYKELYGEEIHVGIGINAGDAIVGNIGCLRRMDYTAIGDTVNTASRLESKAAPDQILISGAVLSAISDRAKAEHVGALELKGKSQSVDTYSVTEINKPKAPNTKARKEFINEARILYSKVGANLPIPEFFRKE